MLLPEKEDSLIFSDGRRLLVLETMRCHSFGFDSLSRPLNVHRGVDSPRKCFLFLSILSPDLPKLPQHKRSNLGESLGREQQSADRGLAEKTCEGREGGVLPFEGYLAHNPPTQLTLQVSTLVDQGDIHLSSSFPEKEFSSRCSKKLSARNIRARGSLLRFCVFF